MSTILVSVVVNATDIISNKTAADFKIIVFIFFIIRY
jgi:hypothetical protein